MLRITRYVLFVAAIIPLCSNVRAIDWGTVKGRFVLNDGAQPRNSPGSGAWRKCGQPNVGNIPLVGAFVWLRAMDVPINKDLMEFPEKVRVRLEDRQFKPRCFSVRLGQTIEVVSDGKFAYNAFIGDSALPSASAPPPSVALSRVFKTSTKRPIQLGSRVFPEVNGWAIVLPHPYVSITDESGFFTIAKVPIGDWDFQVWQEDVGWVRNVKIAGENRLWRQGVVTISVAKEGSDLGVIGVGSIASPGRGSEGECDISGKLR